ncbi:unnamed protein product [Cyclocybe aegerita]|uniref:Uncharacterized protein n=1 Tax=Cyclocybe aegerita TaxID=1973307 RepID=A0A8S0VR74_CYCAE|nr:unnamed protein product [Cyclocybe aegerita]
MPMLGQARAKQSDENLSEVGDDIVLRQLRRHRTGIPPEETASTNANQRAVTFDSNAPLQVEHPPSHKSTTIPLPFLVKPYLTYQNYKHALATHFPTLYTAFPRLPFALVPFAFSQFILIEGLAHQGWIEIFARWLVVASGRRMYPTIWLVGILGVVLCNISGTNIGATILLTKVVRAASLSALPDTDINLEAFNRSAAISLAVASNIGTVSFTFSASLAGLLWRQILNQKGIFIRQRTFAWWNLAPLVVMTGVGLAVVCAEMAVLY